MKLRIKFLILIGLIVILSFGVTFYRTSSFQNQLVMNHAERQARMLSRQVLLTRKWVADHNGLFFVQKPGVAPNPFLDEGSIRDTSGQLYVKRNPAMVTRELSEYSVQENFCRFRVTSLKPVNPDNAPDEFERRSLLLFEKGEAEVFKVESGENGRILRYLTPLIVEDSCLECHLQHGYKVGDIKGGLSLTIPLSWADKAIKKNNKMLLAIGFVTVLFVAISLFLLIEYFIVRRLGFLSQAMEIFPAQNVNTLPLPQSGDEIGQLSEKFKDLGERLVRSQEELEKARQQMCQIEKMAALGRLSAGIAHEINNPLGGMRNCVKSMQESPDDQELRNRYLDLLNKGLQRIEHTMRQLLNFGRQEPLTLQAVQVDDLIRECFDLLEYRLKNIALNLDLNLSGSHPVDIEALRQVIVNIGLNAIQAMPDGGTLTIRTKETSSTVVISFEDTGQGIAEEHVDKIFDPFYTTKDIGEGTGLGLAVSFSLIQRMNGVIAVESKEGIGSRFWIELPKRTL